MKNTKIDIDKLNRELFLITHREPELLDEMLRNSGFDPEKLEKNGVAKIKALLFKQKVALNKQTQESLYTIALTIFESAKESTKEGILNLLRLRAPQLQFNNLEKMDEQDLKEILDESDLLDLMNKIERKEL
ncbi:hypothetical protein SAMN05216464_11810 [Mucilaginibacter pineti]|uniref:Uncharacterized protein n=1 Tax=Mucilaginibacter pineti TaxID=1391627 RepID=A0A1G7L259_9SPHI|nr:hypothetical protein [Mucilaginibacter pineti]SDF43632.1 hypothetical protein SAMN05216464_11810 [Mucilaginibacter pineti]